MTRVNLEEFGWLKTQRTILGKLGPEPLDESFTAEEFFGLLHNKKRIIKSLLLDQSFIAGLGNIYTDESLHLAGIHPLTISKNLNLQTSKSLLESIRQVLKDGIRTQRVEYRLGLSRW